MAASLHIGPYLGHLGPLSEAPLGERLTFQNIVVDKPQKVKWLPSQPRRQKTKEIRLLELGETHGVHVLEVLRFEVSICSQDPPHLKLRLLLGLVSRP